MAIQVSPGVLSAFASGISPAVQMAQELGYVEMEKRRRKKSSRKRSRSRKS